MKFTATTAVLALAGTITASPLPGPEPFQLELSTSDKSLNGKQIGVCHAGAAIEAACIVDNGKGVTLYQDPSSAGQAPLPNYSAPGSIIYQWNIDNTTENLLLTLFGDYVTNVQEGIFEPVDNSVGISFDSKQVAGIFSYLDDSVTPPTDTDAKFYNNFYVCETNYAAYVYQTLSWVVGNGSEKPQNPSCVKVDVIRKTLA